VGERYDLIEFLIHVFSAVRGLICSLVPSFYIDSFSSLISAAIQGEAGMEGSTVHSGKSPMTVGAGITLEDVYQTHLGLADSNLDLDMVVARERKLGIVLDNPSGVMPVVHPVGKRSALRDEVLVSDLLLSVDEVDCKGMSCRNISTHLGSRSQNAARTLVLARGSTMNHASRQLRLIDDSSW
jgi:hypothetical protein